MVESKTSGARARRMGLYRRLGLSLALFVLSMALHFLWAEWRAQTAVFRSDVPSFMPYPAMVLLLAGICGGLATLIERAFYGPARVNLRFRLRRPALVSSLVLTLFTPATYLFAIPLFGIWILGGYLRGFFNPNPHDLALLLIAFLIKVVVFYGVSCCVLAVFRKKRPRVIAFICVGFWAGLWVTCVQGSFGL